MPTEPVKRLLAICNDRDYFNAHRRHVAERAAEEGWTVRVMVSGSKGGGQDHLDMRDFDFDRKRFSIFGDSRAISAIRHEITAFRPTVIHAITMKICVFAAMALLTLPKSDRRVVLTFPGLGQLFQGCSAASRLRRATSLLPIRLLARRNGTVATFENSGDRDRFVSDGIISEKQGVVLAGAGIDISEHGTLRQPGDDFRVLWASRLLRAKGIDAFRKAATLSAEEGLGIRYMAAGYSDPGNADGLSEDEIESLRNDPHLDFLGVENDMPSLLARVDAVCLPTRYGEGLPRVLIEAAASGLPMIATDMPACREIVRDGETGIVLTEPSANSVHKAVRYLASHRDKADRMGANARQFVRQNGFDQNSVQNVFLKLFG